MTASRVGAGVHMHASVPVVVGQAPGHHWFPTVHLFDRKNILCEVVTAADKAQGKWPATLYLSRDVGASWSKACDTDSYGPASVSLGRGRLLLLPYETWPLAPGDKHDSVADGTLVTLGRDGTLSLRTSPVKFLGFPQDLADYNRDELAVVTNGNVVPLRDGRLFTTMYGHFAATARSGQYDCFGMTSADGGYTWNYLAVVANWRDTPGASEGPCESNTARLPDGRLMCVYRVGSGRAQHYYSSTSADEGATWSKPQRFPAQWSVEPQLVCLDNGVLLLCGGRPGIMLWAAPDGTGATWQPFNLAAHHNATYPQKDGHYPAGCVELAEPLDPACTTSYTCMKAIGRDEVLICYDRLGNGWVGAPGAWGPTDAVFVVRVRVRRQSGRGTATRKS